MAVPKRRTSKARKRKRRTHFKTKVTAAQACPRCGDPKLPHRVCPTCGYYKDTEVIQVETEF
jgi:large subunit ribosomal protein L32